MRFANCEGKRILPNPLKHNVTCPLCFKEVIAKCGEIKVWHWSHKSLKDCDNWGEGETKWHLDWKSNFPIGWQEYIMTFKGDISHINGCELIGKKHIADVLAKNNRVIEFQNSPISSKNIIERERFYGNMIWVLNGEKFAKNLEYTKKGKYYTFRWKWFPRSWEDSKQIIIIDESNLPPHPLNGNLFIIKKIYTGGRVGGWGKFISKEDFIRGVVNGYKID